MESIMQQKRGTTADLNALNPTPASGEIIADITTHTIKVGDGSTPYNDIPNIVNASFANGLYTGKNDFTNTQFPLSTYMLARINDGGIETTSSTNSGRVIRYSYPSGTTQGVLSIGTTQYSDYNSTPYYMAGKLQLIAPETLTHYDGTNEYTILTSGNISSNPYIAGLVSRIEALELGS